MSTTPNEAKRARKTGNADVNNPTTVFGSNENINTHSSGNGKWKRRLHSLRRSLTRKRVPDYKEYGKAERQNIPEGEESSVAGQEFKDTAVDIRFDNGRQSAFPNDLAHNDERKSPVSSGKCSSNDVSPSNHPIASDNKTSVKKRKGFGRRTKGGTVRGNKNNPKQQDLPNDENETVLNHSPSERDTAKRRRKRLSGRKSVKSMFIFPNWFKTFGRSSGAENVKLDTRGLSVSTGNFNEHERNFKLLTDVRLLRDPGYVSSSADSLDRNDDLYEDKYNSLRRSRASLIDIKWHKHGQSEGNVAASPEAVASRTRSPLIQTTGRGTSSPNVAEFPQGKEVSSCINNNNCDNDTGAPKRGTSKARRNRANLRNRNSVSECVSRESCAQKISLESNCENCKPEQRDVEKNGSSGLKAKSLLTLTLPDVGDVYLTADEDTNCKENTPKLCGDLEYKLETSFEKSTNNVSVVNTLQENEIKNSPAKEKCVCAASTLPVTVLTDDGGNTEHLVKSEKHDLLTQQQSEGTNDNISPASSSPVLVLDPTPTGVKIGGDIQSAKDNRNGCQHLTDLDRCHGQPDVIAAVNLQMNSSKLSLGHLDEYQEHSSPLVKSRNYKSLTRLHSPDTCHDVVFMRPPKKPAPKPPFLMKHRSQSLTTLAGKSPGLSEQLALNETSSVHKLNDSCEQNLCELLSQSKGKSQSSEGVYVGILGDQGVILRKKRVLPKRVFSMPVELLENVMEVDGAESSILGMNDGSVSEINMCMSSFQSSGSDDYLSCNSKSPSPVITGLCNIEKECCMRSLSISSIEVQDLSTQKKVHSQSVPCLVLNKESIGVKSTRDNLGQDSTLVNVELSSPNCFMEDCKGCSKSTTAQSMVSLNHCDLFEEDTDTSGKVTGKPLMYAEALWDHVTMNEEELCFTAGQAIAVYDIDEPEWWFGLVDDHIGWFPASFVRIPVSGDLWNKYQNWSVGKKVTDVNGMNQICGSNSSTVCLSKEEVRTKILEEIVHTEKDYVENLKDIVEGYLKQARRRRDMFSDDLLEIIFSNIESIYQFHLDFLRCIQDQCKEKQLGKIGEAFVNHSTKFSLYSEYCNNHPRASFELKNLLRQDKYRYFFEACRLLQEMIRISLDGFLLTPVQKICKYPLQLQELLKYTDEEHEDYENVKNALEVMREVASNINEKKRKVENIKKIAEWQLGIEQWEGEDVLLKSSQLVHSGEVTKISKGRAQQVTLFLFDHQIVYCRKDLIKKRSLEYKGRIVLENYKFENLEDDEVSQNGMSVKNAWRLSDKQNNTSCLFQAKTLEQRDRWVRYFLQERKIVYESTTGNSIPLEERRTTMDAARNVLKNRREIAAKGEQTYGKFNTVGRALGQLHYGSDSQRRRIELPPPVSSAMLFQRNEARSSFGLLRGSGVFRKRRPKVKLENKTIDAAE